MNIKRITGHVLNISIWITLVLAACGAINSACVWYRHGGFRGIAGLLGAIAVITAGWEILKRKKNGRRDLLFYLWLVTVMGIAIGGINWYKTGTFYPGSSSAFLITVSIMQTWILWLLFLLYHPWVKACFEEESKADANSFSSPKMFCQSESIPLLPQGYFMDFCEHSEYSNCAGGKTIHRNAICPICRRSLTRHLHLDLNTPELERLKQIAKRNSIDFYYCMRCSLLEDIFQYRIDPEDGNVQITAYEPTSIPEFNDDYSESWLEEFESLELPPAKPFQLKPVSPKIQSFLEKATEDDQYFHAHVQSMKAELHPCWNPD